MRHLETCMGNIFKWKSVLRRERVDYFSYDLDKFFLYMYGNMTCSVQDNWKLLWNKFRVIYYIVISYIVEGGEWKKEHGFGERGNLYAWEINA